MALRIVSNRLGGAVRRVGVRSLTICNRMTAIFHLLYICLTNISASAADGLGEDQRMVQETALSFAKSELAPNMSKWDEDEHWDAETFRKLGSLGFAGIYAKEEFGGTGLSRLDASVIFEALSTGCVSTTAFLSIHKCAIIE